jgi:signal transduction histidine kinase/HAMP domain-containing protein
MAMLRLRQKLTLSFGGLLALLLAVGTLGLTLLNDYSSTLETIFRENYDSVVYGQRMKDALDGTPDAAAMQAFEEALAKEQGNLTLPGEPELAQRISATWAAYKADLTRSDATRRELRRLAQRVIDLNLGNIVSVDGQVRAQAVAAKRMMYALLATGVLLAVATTALSTRSILRPLRLLTDSVREIEHGNLDLTVSVQARDEFGQLADAFNAMAARLREFRRSDRAKLFRTQKTTQIALDTLPDAIAIVSLDGKVELSNVVARRQFGLEPDTDLARTEPRALWESFVKAFSSLQPVTPRGYESVVQIFDGGNERFYLPRAEPILDGEGSLTGITVVLADVTNLRRLDEMKSNLLGVVSHELRTPLTSIRMATHLLLEERIGPLNAKQTDLLVAARDDADRLNSIIENLLDMSRIESGRAQMQVKPTSADQLVLDATDRQRAAYRDKGVELDNHIEVDLPNVLVAPERIHHVFSNLLDNALRHTSSGGRVELTARRDGQFACFEVKDTGHGIPAEHLQHIFERFYRVPDQAPDSGAGLGLAIAKEIVEAHGGRIMATSVPGRGSAFAFTVPLADI